MGKPMDDIARFVRVSRGRICQLKQQYKNTGVIPKLKNPGWKKKHLDLEVERVILDAYQIFKSRPVILEKNMRTYYGLAIPYNTIYQMMLLHQLVIENPRKEKPEKMGSRDQENGLLLSSMTHPGCLPASGYLILQQLSEMNSGYHRREKWFQISYDTFFNRVIFVGKSWIDNMFQDL